MTEAFIKTVRDAVRQATYTNWGYSVPRGGGLLVCYIEYDHRGTLYHRTAKGIVRIGPKVTR